MSAVIRNNKNISSTKKTPAGLQDNNPSRRTPAWRSNSNPPPSVYAPPPSNNAKPQQQQQQQPHAQFPPLGNNNNNNSSSNSTNPTGTPSQSLNPASPPATASFAHPSPSSPPSTASAAVAAPDTPLPPSSLIGQIIIVTTRTGQRYQGALVAVPSAADAEALIQLKDVQDLASATPANIIKENFSLSVGNIVHWSNPSSASSLKISLNGNPSEFRTDGDITQNATSVNIRRFINTANGGASGEGRELQAWKPDSPPPYAVNANPFPSNSHLRGDEATFGPGANTQNGSWDQFATNERMFGVKTSFNEDLYTTKLDRNTPDFKERERKAMAIAQEIMSSGTSNTHVAEERNATIDDSGANEEDKYAGVNRSANAYIPPARRSQQPVPQQTNSAQNLPATSKPNSPPLVSSEVPKVSLSSDGPGATTSLPTVAASGGASPTPTPSPSVSANASSPSNKPPADLTSTFREFVAGEKQRLTQKRAAIVRSEMDKRMSELVKFSKDFKLNKPIPEDIVKIIAKDETKQQQIREKAAKDAGNAAARSITGTVVGGTGVGIGAGPRVVVPVGGAANVAKKVVALPAPTNASPPNNSGANAVAASATTSPLIANATSTATSTSGPLASTTAATAAIKRTRIPMVISPIPPFNPYKLRGPAAAAQAEKEKKEKETLSVAATPSDVGSSVSATATGTASLAKLNINAPAFKLKVGAPAFKPSTPTTTSSPSLPSVSTPSNQATSSTSSANAFFGTRVIKKGAVVHVKDDFNPFKGSLVGGKSVDAATVSFTWPFSGKKFMQSFPNLPPPPPATAPGSAPTGPLHHSSHVHSHTPMSPGAPMVPLGMGMMGGMAVPPGGPSVVMPNMTGVHNVSGVPGVPGMNMNVAMIPPGTPSLATASVVTTPGSTGNGVPGSTPGSGTNSQGPIPGSVPPPSNVMNVVGLTNQSSPPTGAAPPPVPPGPPGPPPPSSYEDDQHRAAVAAATAAAYGMVYYPPPYGYPGQPLLPPGAPPGSYIPSPYLPPMHYPHMSHNGHPMYAHGPPPMGGIPPHQQYMHHPPPPPGAYPAPPPPPNGTGRGSMPPTPMPHHAHPYYHHPSPQISHAVPYSMMMPPPPGTSSPAAPPPHSYDHNPQQPMGHS